MAGKRGGLGKGLDAIFLENDAEDSESAVTLKISEIDILFFFFFNRKSCSLHILKSLPSDGRGSVRRHGRCQADRHPI